MRTLSSFGVSTVLVVLVGMLGCAGNLSYVYNPETVNATVAGLPAERTPIPPERPQGAVAVTSYGITQLRRDGMVIPALHVRAIVTNDGDDTPWTLDTTEQRVAIAGEGQSRAMYVNSDVGTLPKVTIARHERRVLEFFFPLPDRMRNASSIPRFDMFWQVNTPERTVASRTSFERVAWESMFAYNEPVGWPQWTGYGPYWWYDPSYRSAAFIHVHPSAFYGPVGSPSVGLAGTSTPGGTRR